ncbi:subtilisin-like protease SBT1.7 [Actinidia eriantha]|uniref:subtilisin-like protease SBT1.7 n=1 Tax=Actinidia eriantha TaxID=165200 RepID=UPI002583751A|nr:subtilisin-like protease SBT1.7 [Actinidia eriantha]
MASSHFIFSVIFVRFLNSAAGNNMSSYLIFVNHDSITSLPFDDTKWLSARVFYTYEALRGFAAMLTEVESAFIATLPGVTAVLKDQANTKLQTTRSPEFLGLNQNLGLWPDTNFGENVIIGLVDTGIWPEAASFNDAGLGPVPSGWKGYCEDRVDFNSSLCNKKLIGAKYFMKGFNNAGFAYQSPRDETGHGTHVASTAAGVPVEHANLFGFAEGTARGIASKARIAMYKACAATCFNSDILAALESAIKDGVHVLSLSLVHDESEAPYFNNIIARGGFAAMERGIFVTCAAGNGGPSPTSVMNTAPWLTTVGAGSIDRTFPIDVVLGDGQVHTGSSLFSSNLSATEVFPLVYVGICDSLKTLPQNLTGKIVVCSYLRGLIFDNALMVQAVGAAGFIAVNPKIVGEELKALPYPLPAASVSFNEGKQIISYIISTQNPFGRFVFNIPRKERAPALASFSSRGPNPLVLEILKPDLIAPGLNILAAFSPNVALSESLYDTRREKFNIISGTSMACPHVAGAASLLRARHPSWSPAAIRSALMTTAATSDNQGIPILDYKDMQAATALGIGSGYINPNGAVDPGLVYDASVSDYISFLCSLNYTEGQMKLFTAKPNPCSGSAGSPGNLNYPSFSVVFKPNSNIQVLTRTVTCVGEMLPEVYHVIVVNSETEKVTITVEPQMLSFNSVGEQQMYKIKFETNFAQENDSRIFDDMMFGFISWESEKHMVRSPISVIWIPEPVYGFEPSPRVKNAGAYLWPKLSLFLTQTMCLLVTSFVFPLGF